MGLLAHLQQPLQHGYTVDAPRSIRRTRGPARARASHGPKNFKWRPWCNAATSVPLHYGRRFARPRPWRALAGPSIAIVKLDYLGHTP